MDNVEVKDMGQEEEEATRALGEKLYDKDTSSERRRTASRQGPKWKGEEQTRKKQVCSPGKLVRERPEWGFTLLVCETFLVLGLSKFQKTTSFITISIFACLTLPTTFPITPQVFLQMERAEW